MVLIIIFLAVYAIGISYAVINLLRKLEKLENILEENTNKYITIYNGIKEIDSRGLFEADDDVGGTFKDIKELIEKNLDNLNDTE